MAIEFDASRRIFHLRTQRASYLMGVNGAGTLIHLYWGVPLQKRESLDGFERDLEVAVADENARAWVYRQEYRVQEAFDFGEPALLAVHPDGVRSLRLRYAAHRIDESAGQLSIILKDEHYPVEVELVYRLWDGLPLISRHSIIRNLGDAPVALDVLRSATWHLPLGVDYRLTHLAGEWGAEYRPNRHMLTTGRFVMETSTLVKEAMLHVPFFALDPRGETTDTAGEVYYGMLHWSGDFKIVVENQFPRCVSVTGGYNDFDCSWTLAPGESVETPLFTAGYTTDGFDGMTRTLYDWQMDHLGTPRLARHPVQPVLYNLWYPFEMDINEEKALSLVDKAAGLGVELFVIDDGWFKGRQSIDVGLGDWVPDPERFPRGMSVIADACHKRGMMFGLWVEPEMVDPDSDLYRAHPDWILGESTRERNTGRGEYILNVARDEVVEGVISALDRMIEDSGIDYIKWDVNRCVSEKGWAGKLSRRDLSIRWMRGIYRIWQHLNDRYPHLLLENCASGGGRADFGLMPLADRINRSDNADPADVPLLHEGFTRLFLPRFAGGAGTVAPNRHHLSMRLTPLEFRIHLGLMGGMSIGLNINAEPDEALDKVRAGIATYKKLRDDLHDAYVYVLASQNDGPIEVFAYVKRDGSFAAVFAFAHGMHYWETLAQPRYRLRGLPKGASYMSDDGCVTTAEALENIGLSIPLKGDYCSAVRVFRRVGSCADEGVML